MNSFERTAALSRRRGGPAAGPPALAAGYRTPEEVRAVLSRLTGRAVHESVTLFPPFYNEFGRNHHRGRLVSADAFNRSRLQTVLAAAITSNSAMAAHPGNVLLPAASTGLSKDSVVDVTQLLTVDREDFEDQEPAGGVPVYLMTDLDAGLCLVLNL